MSFEDVIHLLESIGFVVGLYPGTLAFFPDYIGIFIFVMA
jgi:hypothetical protein